MTVDELMTAVNGAIVTGKTKGDHEIKPDFMGGWITITLAACLLERVQNLEKQVEELMKEVNKE